jgi:hypothetical protein
MHTRDESFLLEGDDMKIWPKLTGLATLGLGALSFIGMVYRIFAYGYFRSRTIIYVEPGRHDELLSIFIAVSLLIMFAFHIVALFTTVYHLQLFGDKNNLGKGTLVCVIISFMSIFATIGCLSDIGKEASMGWDVVEEWRIVYLSLVPQALTHGLVFMVINSGLRSLKKGYEMPPIVRDEAVFYTVHYTGLLCGAIGLGLTFLKFFTRTSVSNLRNLVIYWDAFIIAPYLLIAAFWIFIKRKEKIGEWYDEKQLSDVGKAGFLTLIATIPFMAGVYAVAFATPGSAMSVLWFPFILHFVLVSFSGITLYLKNR